MLDQDCAELLTVDETARMLGVSPATVRRRIRAGEIPALKLGRGPAAPVRVDADELREWLYANPEGVAA